MLRLRPFRTIDAKTIITWTSNPKEFYMWSSGLLGGYPVSEQNLLKAVSARENNTGYFPLVTFDEEGLVGFLTIRTPSEDDKKVALGYVIVNPNKRGKGYGKEMLKLTLKFVFELYGASEVSLDVFDTNTQAYNCYKSVGFKETGKQELLKIKEYSWNYIEMKIKSSEYKSKKQQTTLIEDILIR